VRRQTQRVVVTGMGCVSALGNTVQALAEGMSQGRSGLQVVDEYRDFPARVFAPAASSPALWEEAIAPKVARKMTRPMLLLFAAVREALESSGLLDWVERIPIGLIAGTTANYPVEMDTEEFLKLYSCSSEGKIDWRKYLASHAYPHDHFFRHTTNLLTCFPALHFGLTGLNETVHNACATGSQTVGSAFRLIKHGHADVVLAGGAESLMTWAGVSALVKLGVLSPEHDPRIACRPFDLHRDGLVLGEGAGVLVIESLASARRRGVPVLAEVVGFGSTANAYRITDSPVDGYAASRAIVQALHEGGIGPDEVDAISAHATSTPQNDLAETNAIKKALGERSIRIPVCALKALIGHTLSAAGAIELIAGVCSLRQGLLPPVPSYRTPDPACDLNVVTGQARSSPLTYLLKNSFGFGGQNGCVLMRSWTSDSLATTREAPLDA
jgi:3-oxoacyl-[acyl-carrier-protein] synthase II